MICIGIGRLVFITFGNLLNYLLNNSKETIKKQKSGSVGFESFDKIGPSIIFEIN